ncbi:hypothetical protein MPER_02839 [Moniliophthora perniciosa FA553]|nr:hypothetical protein MPER_02839 [Moniliophthora perniciosa FA553]
MAQPRPIYTELPATVDFGSTFTLSVTLPSGVRDVSVWAMDLGFATHGVHMDTRAVKLSSILLPGGILTDKRTILVTGVPSFGHKTIIGTGASPPVDQAAIDNMLRSTSGPSAR